MAFKLSVLLSELKRRKVYRVAVVYVVVGAGIWAGAEVAFPALNLPAWCLTLVVVLTLVGFPIALILAWAYEVRPEEPRGAEATPAAVVETRESGQRKSIVVLPFDNISPDPGDAYFADGLTEEIITNLSHIRSLRVISRNSAMVFKGTQKNTRTIAQELSVQYVLEGSVRKAGNDLRVTAQLIDAGGDEHLWAEKYDGVLADVFRIQEETARSIVEALEVKTNPGERERLVDRPIDDVQAYECYLRARNDIHKGTAESLESALRHLKAGLEILGENELLYQGMGEVQLQAYEYGVKVDEETLRLAEDFSEK